MAGTLAANDAEVLIQDAMLNLTTGDGSLLRKYFRSSKAGIAARVTSNFGLIAAAASRVIQFYRITSADPTKYAVSQRFGPLNIYLAQKFFAAPELGRNSRAGTIVHELTHIVFGTYDYDYGPDVESLPLEEALYNADTYEYFAEDSAQR